MQYLVVGLPNLTANGITEQEAINRLKDIFDAQFKNGKLVTIDIDVLSDQSSESSDPWITNMGIFQDDPIGNSWQKAKTIQLLAKS